MHYNLAKDSIALFDMDTNLHEISCTDTFWQENDSCEALYFYFFTYFFKKKETQLCIILKVS